MGVVVAGRDGLDTLARRVGRRRGSERVLRLAEHLPDHDRLLVEAVYGDGRTIVDVARLCRRTPDLIGRRLASILRRLRSPLFAFVALRGDVLPAETRTVARLRFLDGRTLAAIARITRLPLHRVREHVRTVECVARYVGEGG